MYRKRIHKKVCDLCHNEITETIDAKHYYTESGFVPATCSHPKQITYVCSVCGASEMVEDGTTLLHTFGEWSITVSPTAYTDGNRTRECSECHYVEEEVVPKIAYIEVSANDLWNAFDENEVAAEQKYNGKKVRVTGIISDINSGSTLTSANVLLRVDNGFIGCVQCNFNSTNAKELANLIKGESVTIEGTCGTLSIYNLMISSCEVIK